MSQVETGRRRIEAIGNDPEKLGQRAREYHTDECDVFMAFGGNGTCDCGFIAAVEALVAMAVVQHEPRTP